MTPTFRVYTNPDVVGCEIAGALKNVIAIAAGIAHGLGYGDNTKAALITRGLAELARLGMALGGDPLTFSGLAGMGDLVATCTSDKSRNRTVGVALGQGRALDDIVAEMKMVAEGVKSTEAVLELGRRERRRAADRRAGRRGALRGPHPGRHRPRADAAPGQARAPRDAVGVPARRRARELAGGRRVDARGAVQVVGEAWSFDWWIGADDRWRLPAVEAAVRQRTVEGTPVVETCDAGARRRRGAAGVRDRRPGRDRDRRDRERLAGRVRRRAHDRRRARAVAAHGPDDRGRRSRGAARSRRHRRAGPSAPTPLDVETIGAETGPFPRAARPARASSTPRCCYPLSHRNRLRVALVTSARRPRGPVDLALAADAATAAAGWHALLDTGMRVVLPDPPHAGGGRARPVAGAARSRSRRGRDRRARGLGARRRSRVGLARPVALGPPRRPASATAPSTSRRPSGLLASRSARALRARRARPRARAGAARRVARPGPRGARRADARRAACRTRSGGTASARRCCGRSPTPRRAWCCARPASTPPGRPPTPPARPSSPPRRTPLDRFGVT